MKNNQGFTLIEVLASIAILGIIITTLFNINIAGFRFMAYNQDRVELQDQARVINTNLERQIRKATNADISNNKILLSGGAVKIYVDESVTPMQLILEDPSGIRTISDKVINSYTFTLIDDIDQDRIYFEFELIKDNSRYELQNTFFPRAKN